MEHKTFDLLEVKADGEKGEFSALASVFNNVDLVGDRMMPGAFKNTLERWRQSGDPIPIVLSHDWDDPMKYVGEADPRAVVETEKGLLVQGKLDIGDGNPVADQVYKLMKRRTLKGWSFGYTVPRGGQSRGKDGANEVREVDLVEVGPTLKGANPEAQLQAIKSGLDVDEAVEPAPSSDATALSTLLFDIAVGDLADDPFERIEKSDLPDEMKTRLRESVEAQLKAAAEDSTQEPQQASVGHDPLRQRAEEAALEVASGGLSLREPPKEPAPEPIDAPDLKELRRRESELVLAAILRAEESE